MCPLTVSAYLHPAACPIIIHPLALTLDDILRARIKTVGVTEYRFCPKMGVLPQQLSFYSHCLNLVVQGRTSSGAVSLRSGECLTLVASGQWYAQIHNRLA